VLSDEIGTVSYPEIATLPQVRVVPPSAPEAAAAIADLLANARALPRADVTEFLSWERIARIHLDEYAALARGRRAA
jgi:hypothetical protein